MMCAREIPIRLRNPFVRTLLRYSSLGSSKYERKRICTTKVWVGSRSVTCGLKLMKFREYHEIQWNSSIFRCSFVPTPVRSHTRRVATHTRTRHTHNAVSRTHSSVAHTARRARSAIHCSQRIWGRYFCNVYVSIECVDVQSDEALFLFRGVECSIFGCCWYWGVDVVVVVVVVIVGVVVVGVVCWCFALSARIVDHGYFSSIISVRMCVCFHFVFFVPSIRMPCAACTPTRRRQLQFAHSIPVVVCLFVRFYICACFCLWWAHLVNICVYGAFGLCVSRSVSTVIVGVVV